MNKVKIYKAPDPALPKQDFTNVNLFLAGGISNCKDWQEIVSNDLLDWGKKQKLSRGLNVFNPRREVYLHSREVAVEQITWEHERLMESSHVLFWFPNETVCPITLFELGKMLALRSSRNLQLYIGIHPEYIRKLDIEVQTSLLAMHQEIYYSLPDLVKSVTDYMADELIS